MFCCAVLCVLASFAIILMGKGSWLVCLFVFLVSCDCDLMVPWVGLQFLIVVFPDYFPHIVFGEDTVGVASFQCVIF